VAEERLAIMSPSQLHKTSNFEADFRLRLTACVCNTARLGIRKGFVDKAA